jgi:homoserine O-acetyltransferase
MPACTVGDQARRCGMLYLLPLLLLQAATTQTPPLTPASKSAPSVSKWPAQDAQFTVRDFRLRSGEAMPELRINYTTLGSPHRNAKGEIDNAVMVLHGTGGTGRQFLAPQFADELYGPGQPLDIKRYWIILPDGIGHGKSSKPSDGLHMRFPHYDYDDMVEAQYRLLHDGLGIRHMRLIMGTSMGCMHSLIWGETHPDFSRALMPLACEPVEIAGLNRMWRKLAIDGIEADPAWAVENTARHPRKGFAPPPACSSLPGPHPSTSKRNTPGAKRPRRLPASGLTRRSRVRTRTT